MNRLSGIQGVSKLRRTLRRMPEASRRHVQDAIAESAEVVLFEALRNVLPFSTRVAREMSVRPGRDGLSARVGVLGRRANKRAFFAKWLEFGTAPHSLKAGSRSGGRGRSAERLESQSGGLHPGTPARHFLSRAFRSELPGMQDRIASAVSRAIAEAAGDG